MIWKLKILVLLLLLRNTSNYQDANTETKTKRERTVASTAVIFEHRLDVLRSDSLPLFNLKSITMRNTNDDRATGTPKAVSAETVIQTITESDDPKNLREHLRCLMDSYLLQPEESMAHPKGQVYCSFLTLDGALQLIERRVV
jgi:hypothetical protein